MSEGLATPQFIADLKTQAHALGISQISSSGLDLTDASHHFLKWLAHNFHGEMNYMAKHGDKRYKPAKLVEETISILTCQLDYHNPEIDPKARLNDFSHAYIAEYALGRDYHKVLRKQLSDLGKWMQTQIPDLKYRAFVDSAPVLERALNQQSGLGFFGKNTMIIHPTRGSYFFLGELFINKTLEISLPTIKNHCGQCSRCIDICPTAAIVAPFKLDARRCISYLTIEHFGAFPQEFRRPIGNRIFGCDDCQIVCPWNRFAQKMEIEDFKPRHQLDSSSLLELFNWTEKDFMKKTEGSPIRRLGYTRWLRNIAIGIGNDHYSEKNVSALLTKRHINDEAVQDHIKWALQEQHMKAHKV